jgi:hypothetical protein
MTIHRKGPEMSNHVPIPPNPKSQVALPESTVPIGSDKINAGYKGPAPNAPEAVLRPPPPPKNDK